MATLQLPLRSDVEHFVYSIDLDGATYGLEFKWNERAAGWFLSVLDVSGAVLVAGRRLVVDFPFLARFRSDVRLPPGLLLAVDMDGDGKDPELGDLGNRVLLLYTPAADLAAALGS